MAWFVRATSIRKHSTQRRQIVRSSKQFFSTWKKWMTYVSLLIAFMAIVAVLVDQLWIRNEVYMMRSIDVVTSGAVVWYRDDPREEIVQQLLWKHYYITMLRGDVNRIARQYPMIGSLSLVREWSAYRLVVEYRGADMVLAFGDASYAVLDDALYPIVSRWSGVVLQVPVYFTGMTLSGMFYRVGAMQLATQYTAIVQWLADEDIQAARYHVASSQIQINTPRQELYFTITDNVYEQLRMYRQLSESTDRIPNQRVIDLGALRYWLVVYP